MGVTTPSPDGLSNYTNQQMQQLGTQIPNGTIDYNHYAQQYVKQTGTGTSSSAKTPIDDTGALSVWDLPAWLDPSKNPNAPTLWFDIGHSGGGKPKPVTTNNGQDLEIGKTDLNAPHSFDIRKNASDIMKYFAAMSVDHPDQFMAIQHLLARGRMYGSASTVYGGWNRQTETALSEAMQRYLQVSEGAGAAISFMQFLNKLADANDPNGVGASNLPGFGFLGGSGGSGGSGAAAGPSLTDPAQLRSYAQTAAQNALGRNLDEGQLNAFVNEFHNQEISAWQTRQAGGSAYTNPDAGAAAEQFVTSSNNPEFKQHEVQNYTDAFLNMFLPSSGSAPNISINQAATGV